MLAYLDDWVIWGTSQSQTKNHTQKVVDTLSRLGFLITIEKSQLKPVQELVWLGIKWFPATGHWTLPREKQEEIVHLAQNLREKQITSRRQWEQFLGKISFACQIYKRLRPYFYPLSKVQQIASAMNRDIVAPLPNSFLSELLPLTTIDIFHPPPTFCTPTQTIFACWQMRLQVVEELC